MGEEAAAFETTDPVLAEGGAVYRTGVTTGPVRATLFYLAMPVLAEQLLNTLVGVVDVFLAGGISTPATAAIGLAAYVSWFASLLVMLVATGTTALVARMEGGRDHQEANRIAGQSIFLSVLLGIGLLALLYSVAPWFARQQKMTGETYAIAVEYLRFDAVGHAFLAITLVGCAAMRGAGNMRTPMIIFAVLNAVNLVASFGLVYGLGPLPALGVRGIVTGTVIAKVVGCSMVLAAFVRRRVGLELAPRDLIPESSRVWRILRIGVPAAGDGAVMWFGHFAFLAIIARLAVGMVGEAYYAAHIVAIRLEAFTYLPAVAWATACATMIGQALGAGDPHRAKRTGYEAVLQCGVLSVVIGVLFWIFAEPIYRFMQPTDPLVTAAGVDGFRILALLQPTLVISIVLVGALRGAGDTRFPFVMTLLGIVFLRLPLGWYCGIVLDGGLIGAWIGMYADMVYRAIFVVVHYARGAWLATAV